MIASVSGVVKAVRSGSVVVEVGGVGLLINVPARIAAGLVTGCLLYTSPSPRDGLLSRMPSSA